MSSVDESVGEEKNIKPNIVSFDDVIILSDGIKWKFPNINYCPKYRCKFRGNRSILIKHFREEHAKNSTICVFCKKVFAQSSISKHRKTHLQQGQVKGNQQATNGAVKQVSVEQMRQNPFKRIIF